MASTATFLQKSLEGQLQVFYGLVDSDNDGRFTAQDLIRTAESMGLTVTLEEAQQMMAGCGTDFLAFCDVVKRALPKK